MNKLKDTGEQIERYQLLKDLPTDANSSIKDTSLPGHSHISMNYIMNDSVWIFLCAVAGRGPRSSPEVSCNYNGVTAVMRRLGRRSLGGRGGGGGGGDKEEETAETKGRQGGEEEKRFG